MEVLLIWTKARFRASRLFDLRNSFMMDRIYLFEVYVF